MSFRVSRRWPWTLVWYFAYWSVGIWYWRIRSASEWHVPQTLTVVLRSGIPRKPLAGLIATVTWSDVGSPPWQSAQPMPTFPCTLAFQSSTIPCCLLSIAAWQVAQVLVSTGARLPTGLGAADPAGASADAAGTAVPEGSGLAVAEGCGLSAERGGDRDDGQRAETDEHDSDPHGGGEPAGQPVADDGRHIGLNCIGPRR